MKTVVLCGFLAVWLIVGVVFFSIHGCSYSKMSMQEVTEDYRFYTVKVKEGQILCVHLLAQHDQDLTWIKDTKDYDVISVDKTYRRRSVSRFSVVDYEAIKVYIQPHQSFTLDWKYITDKGQKVTLYTKIEM